MPDRVQLSIEQRQCLLDPANLPSSVELNGKRYTPLTPLDTGHKGAIWKVYDQYGRNRALKLCLYGDYVDHSYLQEMTRAAALEPYKEFASFVDAGLVELEIGSLPKDKYVCFVEEWIDGVTLQEFVKEHKDAITSSFFVAYVNGMCSGLSALSYVGLRHDDLHAGNVMLARPAPGVLSSDWTIKIVDTGSMKPAAGELTKPKDDHRHFVDHLLLLWNTMQTRGVATGRDRRFLSRTIPVLRSMLDDEPGVGLREPVQIVQQFENAYSRACASSTDEEEHAETTDPFEFISAEHIADDRLLVRMFARSCPFLEKVDGPDPCLVTGPRGCGKSTMFRWLSLKAHLHQPSTEFEAFRIAGFYVSCSSDLQNRLSWIRNEETATKFTREIIHYFNLLLTREVFQTLSAIASRPDRESFWGFGRTEETSVCDFVVKALLPAERPRLQGVTRLTQLIEAIETEMFYTHYKMLNGTNVVATTSSAFLGDLTTLLAREVRYFREKRIAFLIDDFSAHRLPDCVQRVLNQVIWERRSSHVFKLSSEKFGAVLVDAQGASVEIGREMVEVDCGKEYVALDDINQLGRCREFAVELLNNRLRAAAYKGTAESLIGPSNWPEHSLGRALVEKEKGRSNDQYHGIECIADLCSGDVSTLLLIYRRIFARAGVTRESNSRIAKTAQHEAVVSASRELYEATKHYFPCGTQMYSVVGAFGNLVRNILQYGKWQKKGSTRVPVQAPRIELDQPQGAVTENLSEEQHRLARELVRRAIFIEMEPGLSRHRNMTTLRWHLRRVYLPAFGAALAKNAAVKEPSDWFKFFLTNPGGACELIWRRWPRESGEPDEPMLFKGPI